MADDIASDTTAVSPMPFTGERFVPEVGGDIELEHVHRYLLAAHLTRGLDVLDLASGEGFGSNRLAHLARTVVGVDISPEAVAHAKGAYASARTNLTFLVGDCSSVPLPDRSVDAVVSFETIEHHDKHHDMLAEITRVLRPGGFLVISSPNRAEYSDVPNYKNPFHVKELYESELIGLLQAHFAEVSLYGQTIVTGSVIGPIVPGRANGFALRALDGASNADVVERIRWRYYVAVCSSLNTVQGLQPSVLLANDQLRPNDKAQHQTPTDTIVPEELRSPPRPVSFSLAGDQLEIEGLGQFVRAPGFLSGFLERNKLADGSELYTGWAVEAGRTPAEAVLLQLHDAAILVRPQCPRPDIAKSFDHLGPFFSGFEVPADFVRDRDVKALRVLACSNGRFTELPFNGTDNDG